MRCTELDLHRSPEAYLCAMMADWLQGPFVYALYASYGCLPEIYAVFQAAIGENPLEALASFSRASWHRQGFPCGLRIHARGECDAFRGWIRQQRSLWHFRWVAG